MRYQEILKISALHLSLIITNSRLQPHLRGANESIGQDRPAVWPFTGPVIQSWLTWDFIVMLWERCRCLWHSCWQHYDTLLWLGQWDFAGNCFMVILAIIPWIYHLKMGSWVGNRSAIWFASLWDLLGTASWAVILPIILSTDHLKWNLGLATTVVFNLHHYDTGGLVQERRNSSANALEFRLSCTNPSIHGCGWDNGNCH